jgi:Electron transfer DM13
MVLNTLLKNHLKKQLENQFVIAVSILAIASQTVTLTAWAGTRIPNTTISNTTISNTTISNTTGTFVSAEHSTAGQARVIQEGTKRYLILDKAFQTEAGPDLFVILHRTAVPKTYGQKDYVLLGKLQRTAGEQRYEIPAKVDPNAYQSVVIWCRQFSATFGYAPLTRGKL